MIALRMRYREAFSSRPDFLRARFEQGFDLGELHAPRLQHDER